MMALELEAVKALVPKNQKSMITQDLLDRIEGSVKDPIVAEAFKENFVTYLGVLTNNAKRYKLEDYINAVKYVSYKLMGLSNRDAWISTFPERYARCVDEGQPQIDSYATMYNKTKLVVQIYEQTMVPSYILNAPMYQEALNELAMMIKDPSVKGLVKVKALEAILTHTKQPEVIKNELVIGMEQQETIASLRETTAQLAEMFHTALSEGRTSLKQITESKIVEGEYEELEG